MLQDHDPGTDIKDIFLTPIGTFQGNAANRPVTTNHQRRSPSRLTGNKSRTPILKRPLLLSGAQSLFSNEKLIDEAVAACHMLKIPPKELYPKKIEDFMQPGISERIANIRFQHFEERRLVRIDLVLKLLSNQHEGELVIMSSPILSKTMNARSLSKPRSGQIQGGSRPRLADSFRKFSTLHTPQNKTSGSFFNTEPRAFTAAGKTRAQHTLSQSPIYREPDIPLRQPLSNDYKIQRTLARSFYKRERWMKAKKRKEEINAEETENIKILEKEIEKHEYKIQLEREKRNKERMKQIAEIAKKRDGLIEASRQKMKKQQEESFRRAKEVSDKFREYMEMREGYGSARNLESQRLGRSFLSRTKGMRSGRTSSPPIENRKNSLSIGEKDLNRSTFLSKGGSNFNANSSRILDEESQNWLKIQERKEVQEKLKLFENRMKKCEALKKEYDLEKTYYPKQHHSVVEMKRRKVREKSLVEDNDRYGFGLLRLQRIQQRSKRKSEFMNRATKQLKERLTVKMEGAKKNQQLIKQNEVKRLQEISQRGLAKISNAELVKSLQDVHESKRELESLKKKDQQENLARQIEFESTHKKAILSKLLEKSTRMQSFKEKQQRVNQARFKNLQKAEFKASTGMNSLFSTGNFNTSI